MYVARVYAHELQKMSLKDLQPILSQNIPNLLSELAAQEDIRLSYSNTSRFGNSSSNNRQRSYNNKHQNRGNSRRYGQNQKSCVFCKACKKPHLGHTVDTCWSLSRFNKADIVNALMVDVDEPEHDNSLDDEIVEDFSTLSTGNRITGSPLPVHQSTAKISRVEVMKSPSFVCSYQGFPCKVTVDTGATSNIASLSFVKSSGMPLVRTNQGAKQLDGSQVKTCGEVDAMINFGSVRLRLVALVVESADADILAGIPFCKRNNIEVSMGKEEIYVRNQTVKYGEGPQPSSSNIFKADSFLIRSPVSTVLFPGEQLDVSCPMHFTCNGETAIELRCESPFFWNLAISIIFEG